MDTQTAYDLLSHERRRDVVGVLYETSPLSRPELAARLVARESEDATGRPDHEVRRRVRVSLHHNHLPKLADAGAIEYDEEIVAATPELDVLARYLDDHPRDGPVEPTGIGEQLAQFYA